MNLEKNKSTLEFESPTLWIGDEYNDPKKLTIVQSKKMIKDVTPTS